MKTFKEKLNSLSNTIDTHLKSEGVEHPLEAQALIRAALDTLEFSHNLFSTLQSLKKIGAISAQEEKKE